MHRVFGTKENIEYLDREGAYLIPVRNNKVGVIQTSKGYFFLGGGLESGENHKECIERECMEEVGCLSYVKDKICSAEGYYKHSTIGYFHPVQNYYAGDLGEKVFTPAEKDHLLCWIDYEQLRGHMHVDMQNWALEQMIFYQMSVPTQIQALIEDKPFIVDEVGMSGNQVLIFEDMVLKIENNSEGAEKQIKMMQWLQDRVPVPKILAHEVENDKSYLLMSKMGGQMSCDIDYLEQPNILLEALAEGLKSLWEVDIIGCPCMRDLDTILTEARKRVEQDLVDIEDAEPTTFGENGFKSPEELLEWLENNRPEFEPVLSHGDYCLPNIFLEDEHIKGYIDLGKTGISDKWNDIALCYRSLKHNFDGTYGGKVYANFNPDMLFEKLAIKPNWEKINYYLLLDELF